jgi:hypothetical protein
MRQGFQILTFYYLTNSSQTILVLYFSVEILWNMGLKALNLKVLRLIFQLKQISHPYQSLLIDVFLSKRP